MEVAADIVIPVLTMHTIGDLFVPFSMEQIYAERVVAQGASDLFVQRAIRDVGHCAFTTTEWETAFADLVTWVDDGVRPDGDDVFATSATDYGCEFSDPGRQNPPFLPLPDCP